MCFKCKVTNKQVNNQTSCSKIIMLHAVLSLSVMERKRFQRPLHLI